MLDTENAKMYSQFLPLNGDSLDDTDVQAGSYKKLSALTGMEQKAGGTPGL